ncbi:MAG: fibronectin type III domain-containing protein [Muribaculaceae bacterium]|nr:fibronectin type III domain-containing protein [Muribaculaceae bacterium]
MKKHLLFLMILFSIFAVRVNAQGLEDYNFSTGVDATKWIPLTTTTSIITPGAGDYGVSAVQEIGFSFTFGETVYTQFSVNSDGNLRLGSTVTGTSNYTTPFSSSNASVNNPKINFMGCDGFLSDSGHVYKEVVGTAPNRILVVEFATSTYTSSSRPSILRWQVQLFEGTNAILIVYAPTAPPILPATTRQQGMCTGGNDVWLVNASHMANYYTSGQSTTIASGTWPEVNRYYEFTVPVTTCPKPHNVQIVNVTSDEATITWAPQGTETDWEVVAVPHGAAVTTGTPEIAYSYPYTIQNLTDGTQYDVYVRANCGSDYSAWTVAQTFTTDPLCTSPRNVTISQIMGSSALVSWQAALVGAVDYTVEYTEANQNNWIPIIVTGTSTMLSGLTPQTNYQVRVFSNCAQSSADTVNKTFTTGCLSGGEYTVGDGTSTSTYFPSYSLYKNAYSQQIFLATEMNGPRNITSVSIEMTAVTQQRNFKIYMMHTTQSTSSAWIPANNAQLCFQGSHQFVVGWNTFNFNTPFQYNGTDNLVLIVIDENSSYTSGNTFRVHTVPSNTCHMWYSDTYTYSITSTPSGTSSSTTTNRNNVKFGGVCDSTATCVEPNVHINNVTDESITIEWAPGNNENAWNLRYREGNGSWISEGTVTSSPYTLTNLTPNTIYTIQLQSDCGGTDVSEWITVSAKTECSSYIIPFSENFDNAPGSGAGNMVGCWTRNTNYTSTAYPYTSSTYNHGSGSGYSVYFYGTTAYYSYIASPRFDDQVQMNNLQIKFWAYKTSASYQIEVGIMSDPDDNGTFVSLGRFSPTNTYLWQRFEVNTNNYMGNGHYVAFRMPTDITSYMYLDDIEVYEIPACDHVDNIHAVGTPTTTTIDVAWTPRGTETQWNVVYGPKGTITDPSQVTPTVVYTPSISISGLTHSSFYDVYVKSDCGGDTSVWEKGTVHTACDLINTLPFMENFDDYIPGTSSNNVMPICWNHLNTGTSYAGCPTVYNASSYASSGTQCLYFYAASTSTYADQYAILPEIDVNTLPINTLRLSFKARRYSTTTTYVNTIIVGVMTNPSSASSFVPVDTVTLTSTTIGTHHVDFTNYTGTGSYIAIMVPKPDGTTYTSASYNYLDDVMLDIAPACANPTNLHVSNVTTTDATISWTAGSSETEWEIVVVQGNAPITAGTPYSVYTNTETISNLTPGSDYTVYLRAVCPQGGNSEYVSIRFSAACEDLQTLPFTCNFDNVAGTTSGNINNLPTCWTNHCGTYTGYEGYPIVYSGSSYANSGSNSLRFYTYTGTTDYGNQYAVLPPIDVNLYPINTLQMTLAVRKNSTSYANFTLIVGVMTDPLNVSTFTPVDTIVQTETAYHTYTVYFSNYTGTGKYIAIYAPTHGMNAITYNTGYVDDIVVDLAPVCPPVSNLQLSNVGAASAMVTWEESVVGSASSFVLEYSEYNQNNWTTETGITGTSYMLSGLNPMTHYEVRVQSDCGMDVSTWVITDFTTKCLGSADKTIGTGTSTSTYFPSYSLYKNAYSQQIFLASEMNGSGTITSVSFEMTAVAQQRHFKIYMMHTTQSTASAWIPANNAQLCFQGSHNFVVGWNTFEFNTPFQYNGTDNLVLIVIDENSSYTSGNTFRVHTVPDNTCHMWYSDSEIYSTASTPGGTSSSTTTNRNNVIFGICDSNVTCASPNVTIGNIDLTSAEVVWAPGYTESIWNLEYKEASDTIWNSILGVTGSVYTITGLNPSTHYDVRMQSDCGGGDLSLWREVDFYTLCGDAAIPFTENFDGVNGATSTTVTENNLPHCWNHLCGTYSSYAGYPAVYSSSTYAQSGTNALRFYTYTGTTDYGDQYAILPSIDVVTNPLSGLQLTMDVRKNSTSYNEFTLIVGVMDNPANRSTFVPVDTIVETGTAYVERTVYFNNYTGTGTYIALMAPMQSPSTYNTGYVDNIAVNVIPTCPKPASLTATAITTNSITLGWNDPASASSWNIEYGQGNFTPGTGVGTTVTATSNPFTITGLTANTSYTFYVQSDCGGGDLSLFSHAYTVSTACDAVTTLPFTENFDSQTGTTSTSVSVSNLPNCWSNINNGTNSNYMGYPIIYSSSTYSHSGTNVLRFYTGTGTYGDQVAILPQIDGTVIPMNTVQVSFYARALSTSYPFTLVVGVLSNPTSLSSFTPMDTLTITSTTHTLYEIPLGHYTGAGNYIGILAPKPTTGMNYGYVDNITVDLIPSCPKPTNLTASNPTSTTITLSWTENGTSSDWVVEYGAVGFTPGTSAGTTVNVTGTPSTTITGLTSSSTYDFYVKSDCGGGDESPWSVKATGSTLCDAITQLPYTQNFDANPWTSLPGSGTVALMPNCWERINTYSSPRPFCYDKPDYYYNNTPFLYFYATSGYYNIAIMPEVDASIPINTLKVSFMYRGFNASYTTPMSVGVMTDPTNANTYVEVATVPFDATVTNWVSREVSFANYTGTGRFIAFRNGSTSATTYAMMENLVLDYDSTQASACTAPTGVTASNATQTSATITWTAGGTETAWELQYKAASASSWSNSINVTGTPSYNLTGLTAGTQYQVRVRAMCSATETSNWSSVASFTTTQASVTPPTVTTNDATNVGQTTATLNGAVAAGSETITAQGFEWKATTGGTYTAVNATGTTMSYDLAGLSPNTSYTFKAFATTASGTTYGAEKTFTTEEQQTCPTPTNVTVTDITTNSAVVTWTQPDNTASSWTVQYKQSAASSWNSATANAATYTLLNLEPATNYDVQVIANCTNGLTSDPSATVSFTTETVGIDDYTLDNSVVVYPNPTRGTVQVENTQSDIQQVMMYDAYGKLLSTVEVSGSSATIDLSGYADGLYFMRVTTGKGVVTKRVVKQ